MFIKQIIIQGFKSYKDQTVMEPFSPKTNVIVGRNGSGKSNFFSAIRFVLSDAYTSMGREERQGLLHEGSGSAVMSAYVEIIFDNSDGRFIDFSEKEVVLRRTIGLKKDEYAVNRKVISNKDVVQMLESAGFSRSNPYYIVPQGRVTALTNMKEGERLNLLKEVAGTRVYENRRAESLKIMNETNNKREKIDELLKYIKERLDELEEEKEELRGYQDKDRERRCLEYAYHYREQATIQEALEEIDNTRQEGLDNSDTSRTELQDSKKAIANLDAEMQKLQRQLELLQIDRRQLEEDRRDAAKTLAKVELKTKSLSEGQSSREQARAQRDAELESVKAEIDSKKKELSKVTPNYNKKKQQEDEVRRNLDGAEATRTRLFAKQSNGTRFKNRQERDAYLQGEVNDLEQTIATHRATKMDRDEEVRGIHESIKKTEHNVETLRARLANWQGERVELVEKATEAHDLRDKLNDERKLLRREEEKLNSNISTSRHEKDSAENDLRRSMDRETARGLASIRRMKQESHMPGCFGTVADLMEVSDAYRIPAEETAGGRLFEYVVDTEDTAQKLLYKLHEQRGGRVTCLPLNRMRPRNAKLPPQGPDVVPLKSKVKYDAQFEPAFDRIFGNTIVCRNPEVAVQYSRSHGVDCITPEGDTANKRGALSGGYINPKSSRIHAVRAANRRRDEYEALLRQSQEIRKQIEEKDQEITAAMTDCQKADTLLRQTDDGFDPANNDLRNLVRHLEKERSRVDAASKHADTVEKNMNKFMDDQAAYETEMETEFKKSLSAAEERQLEELSSRVQALQKEWNEISSSRRELESRKSILETTLRQNLQLKLDELNSQAFEDSASGTTSQGLKEVQKELAKAQKNSKSVEANLREVEGETEALQQQLEQVSGDKATREQAQVEIAARIEKHQKRIEKGLAKKSILITQQAECTKNIRDLGVLPEEAFEKYENMAAKAINSRLKKVNEALKKYKHVNKKAFEQYNSFTQQQDHLTKRRKELDDSQVSIEELMEHLDRKKDEAIERTFKQVSKEFATIFEKLVPAGQGRLIIQRRTDRRQPAADESEDEGQRSVENYQGVGISVSFNSKEHDEQQRIQQLSGGQKSLCALCLVFALQATESSPMVIFDEVDANLDAQYRTAVASLLENISNEAGTQFICTTFRPEIVHVADKSYGVTFRNKTSSINCVSTAEALEFVEGQAKPV